MIILLERYATRVDGGKKCNENCSKKFFHMGEKFRPLEKE
jgi:hypothetical protein